MDDPGDLTLVEHVLEGVEVGDVAARERDLSLVASDHEREARAVVTEVEADDVVASLEGQPRDPGAEAAEHTRDEHPLAHPARRFMRDTLTTLDM